MGKEFYRTDQNLYQQSVDEVNRQRSEFYGELEATLCSIMASGIPASKIVINGPNEVRNGNVLTFQCSIGVIPH